MTTKLKTMLFATVGASIMGSVPTFAQTEQSTNDTGMMFEEIVVTARLRKESLQDIPDSITAFSASQIEAAGIDDVQDFIDMTPNIIMREAYRAGVTFITIRGITTGQQGWPPVTYVVDGVKAGTLDAINQGALLDIERIEVLKGPQGALYGAGAIAGAINVITKQPGDTFEGDLKLSYGKGNDIKASGAISGPIVEDKLAFRLAGYYNNNDGLIDSTDGVDLDFEEQATVRGLLVFTPTDNLKIDFRAAYTDITAGAGFQDKLSDVSLLDEFDKDINPGPERSGIIGSEDRQITDLSVKIEWDFGPAILTSVAGYQDIEQHFTNTASWGKTPADGSQTLFGLPLAGADAAAGEFMDEIQDLSDNFETYTLDTRLTSNSDSPLRWVLGLELLERKSDNHLGLGWLVGPNPGTPFLALDRLDKKKDTMWGVYGQINYDLTDKLELTLAGRYDENKYSTGQIVSADDPTPVPTVDPDGNPVDILETKDSKFQPKVQLSYDFTDAFMAYATYAEGFRSGFYNTGNRTLPESTKNYEIGFKSSFMDRRLTLNGALFHTDYSDQQFTTVVATPPFRITTNLPSTNINGVELETAFHVTSSLEIFGSLGYLDAEVADGTAAPATPKWTANAGFQYEQPVTDTIDFTLRTDYRRQGAMYLITGNGFPIEAKDYLDIRAGLITSTWSLKAYVDNVLDTQQATEVAFIAGGYVRGFTKPRSYGLELSYSF
ncbi:TonB-dependent receptor [Kordiimonas pumila]|uniref:TonB-dependent receptor n=1 Tax=Kordiimonas pumila TaxID=2161677 RepID=A0ABV7D5K8_9PROT|nr:TonB-dependent receptor [Kordiimonas pumila]